MKEASFVLAFNTERLRRIAEILIPAQNDLVNAQHLGARGVSIEIERGGLFAYASVKRIHP